jgi:hypothetical protein
MHQRKIVDLWMRQEEVSGASFKLNDPVEVVEGDLAGERGSLISLIELEPEPVYLVETSDGLDVKLKESHLQAIE